MKKSNKQYVLQTVTAALLIALKIVLERLMSYSVWNQRFGFAFIAVAFAAAMLGTPWAMAVAGIGDILGALRIYTHRRFNSRLHRVFHT